MQALRWSPDGTRFEFVLAPGPRSIWDPLTPPPDDFSACRVVLLSLFDGVGTARVALDMALRHYRCTPLLHASWYVECDRGLADRLEGYWVWRADVTGEVPSVPLAYDVWGLFRDGAAPLRRLLEGTPLNSVVLVVAGSPCQDLTYAGSTRGAEGAVSYTHLRAHETSAHL
eukprot:2829640-Alexandrium_andersonii.AAC.1